MKQHTPVKYGSLIVLRDRPEVIRLVRKASREAGIKQSQFVRSAVAMALQMAGHDVAAKDDEA